MLTGPWAWLGSLLAMSEAPSLVSTAFRCGGTVPHSEGTACIGSPLLQPALTAPQQVTPRLGAPQPPGQLVPVLSPFHSDT